ncbi:MAG: hypothetical protein MI802_02685, partial [Desulfobacterales bacterium]|nr:hypothetical protein [Desulfobacterales bacterium]
MKHILVVADMWEGQVRPVTRELVSAAFYIRDTVGTSDGKPVIRLLVPSEAPATPAEDLAGQTGLDTLACQWSCPVTPETLIAGLADILAEAPTSLVLMAHTTLGRETAPRLAVRLGWDAVSGVTGICGYDTGLIFDRPVMDNTKIQSV